MRNVNNYVPEIDQLVSSIPQNTSKLLIISTTSTCCFSSKKINNKIKIVTFYTVLPNRETLLLNTNGTKYSAGSNTTTID